MQSTNVISESTSTVKSNTKESLKEEICCVCEDNSYPENNKFKIIKGKEDELRKHYYNNCGEFTTKTGSLILLKDCCINEIRDNFSGSKYTKDERLFTTVINRKGISSSNCNCDNYPNFSMFIPKELEDNIVIAGGSVTNSIIGIPFSDNMDIDIFIVSNDPIKTFKEYLEWLGDSNKHEFKFEYAVCTERVVTVIVTFKDKLVKLQFILRDYKSVEEILIGFDIDASSCCFYKNNYYYTQRCSLALNERTNYIDIDRMSPSYCYRLAKYAVEKGFYVYQPNFNRELVDNTEFNSEKFNSFRKLLTLEDNTNRNISIDYKKSDYEALILTDKDIKRIKEETKNVLSSLQKDEERVSLEYKFLLQRKKFVLLNKEKLSNNLSLKELEDFSNFQTQISNKKHHELVKIQEKIKYFSEPDIYHKYIVRKTYNIINRVKFIRNNKTGQGKLNMITSSFEPINMTWEEWNC